MVAKFPNFVNHKATYGLGYVPTEEDKVGERKKRGFVPISQNFECDIGGASGYDSETYSESGLEHDTLSVLV